MKKLNKVTINLYLVMISFGIFFNSCGTFSCKSFIQSNIYNKSISARITANKEISPCFGIIYFNSDSLEICICANPNAWEIILQGDSIKKNNGTDTFFVYTDGNLKGEFKYPCCDQ